jgi:MerR family transcriptional regulator, light-induced transcriptional regulator
MSGVQDFEETFSISAVERETGLSKDTLRVWERRYAFPQPLRDRNGDRLYPFSQVQSLRVIKRLIDAGQRPGTAVPQVCAGFDKSAQRARQGPQATDRLESREAEHLMRAIKSHQVSELREVLEEALLRSGLQRFVTEIAVPLSIEVGEAWLCGEMAIFEEHLYTQTLQTLLHNAIARAIVPSRPPKVVLATGPNERHGLGLLMAEAVLTAEAVECVPLGTDLPVLEIARAAHAHQADVVALSFSAASPANRLLGVTTDLRKALPEHAQMWVGGAGAGRIKRQFDNVVILSSLEQLLKQVSLWRNATEPRALHVA